MHIDITILKFEIYSQVMLGISMKMGFSTL